MKFYETGDVDFFVESPNAWETYCRYPAKKKWIKPSLDKVRSINFYRDYEGAYMDPEMKSAAYYMKGHKWHPSRIAPWACLPLLYAVGNRFIKLEQAAPSGYKCSEFPMNLKEYRAKRLQLFEEKENQRIAEFWKKALIKECKKKKRDKP